MPSLRDYGFDPAPAGLPYFRTTSKEQVVRIVDKLEAPTLKDQKIPVLARFKVETDPGQCYIWDISSKRLMAQLAELEDVSWPFVVARQGKGTNTTYTIYAKPLPQDEPTPPPTAPTDEDDDEPEDVSS